MTLRFMLDTNVCINVLRRPSSEYRDKFNATRAELCVSTITLHELHHGAERSARPEYQRELIAELTSRLETLAFDGMAAEHSGNIHATLAKTGQVIGAYDMLIAGHARSLGLTIVTNNLREFDPVEGLRCEAWA